MVISFRKIPLMFNALHVACRAGRLRLPALPGQQKRRVRIWPVSSTWKDGEHVAQKRMFSLSVTDTDKFLDMSASAQALYFHLGMHGDDDGFVLFPKE